MSGSVSFPGGKLPTTPLFSTQPPASSLFSTASPLLTASSPLMALPELQRNQMLEFSQRLRAFGIPYGAHAQPAHQSLYSRLLQVDPLFYLYGRQDPRFGLFQEEPKPSHSYIGLIAMGILSAKEQKLVLSDIYQWILDNYPYFRTRGPGWRNSIRHNLSLNDCFIKAGRAANGKGHYWAIHPAVVADFEKGDFRRRRAQRKVRKAMGLAVPDEEDDAESPPPPCSSDVIEWRARMATGVAMEAAEAHGGSGLVGAGGNTVRSGERRTETNCELEDREGSPGSEKLAPQHESSPPRLHMSERGPLPQLPVFPVPGLTPLQWKQLYQTSLLQRMAIFPTGVPQQSAPTPAATPTSPTLKRRAFDVDSLLAPEDKRRKQEENSDPGSPGNGQAGSENKALADRGQGQRRGQRSESESELIGGEESDIDVEDEEEFSERRIYN